MNTNNGLPLVAPRVTPVLDPGFRPAVLATRAFDRLVDSTPGAVPVRLALEQADGSVFRFETRVLPESHPHASANVPYLERLVKFLLWSRGGLAHLRRRSGVPRHRAGQSLPPDRDRQVRLALRRRAHIRPSGGGRPHPQSPGGAVGTRPLGRHLEGCRIGFDLGGSDRKVAAVIDGGVVFSDETVWDPYHKPDPQYHFDGIMDSLKKAAAHLPRVDAIGGSAAGVYVNNRVKAGRSFAACPRTCSRRV